MHKNRHLHLAAICALLSANITPIYAQTRDQSINYQDLSEKLQEYSLSSKKSQDDVPDHIYYTQILREQIRSLPTNSLDRSSLFSIESNQSSRFVEPLWTEMAEICQSILKDNSDQNIIANAKKMDDAAIAFDNALTDYYAEFVDSLSEQANLLISVELENLERRNTINYQAIRIADLTKEAPDFGRIMLMNSCANFSTIDTQALLDKNRGLRLIDEEMDVTPISAQTNEKADAGN